MTSETEHIGQLKMLFTSAQLNLAENSEVCFWPFSADPHNGVCWSSRVQTVGQHGFQGLTATQKVGGQS